MIEEQPSATSAAEAWERYSKGLTSETAHRETKATQSGHRKRVLEMWKYLERFGITPCSHFVAARCITEKYHEHLFSARQTNEEVIRKRTSELVEEGLIVVVKNAPDFDGRWREQYAPPAPTEAL